MVEDRSQGVIEFSLFPGGKYFSHLFAIGTLVAFIALVIGEVGLLIKIFSF
ncbi:MAG: hypothetical protein AAB783_02185 [Patescibacteria group bacterium]